MGDLGFRLICTHPECAENKKSQIKSSGPGNNLGGSNKSSSWSAAQHSSCMQAEEQLRIRVQQAAGGTRS